MNDQANATDATQQGPPPETEPTPAPEPVTRQHQVHPILICQEVTDPESGDKFSKVVVPEEAGITQVAGARKHAMANEITGEHVSVKIVDRFSLTEQKKLAFQK